MIYQSSDTVDIPTCDILSYAFPPNSTLPSSHPIFVDPYTNDSINLAQARCTIRQLIAGLHAHGLSPGDTLCLHSFNNIQYSLIYLAAIGAGARFVGSNPAYKPNELRHLLRTVSAKWLIVQECEAEKVVEAALEVGVAPTRVFILGESIRFEGEELQSWETLLGHGEMDWLRFDDEAKAKNTPAVLLSTSGTTGLPKMAVMSHHAIVTQAALAEYVAGDHRNGMKGEMSDVKRLISLPLFHSFVLPYHILAFRRGDTTFVMPKFDADDFSTFIERCRITDIPMVPPIALRIFGTGYQSHDFSSLREVVCAGAPLGKGTQLSLRQRLGRGARFWQLWGMSETGWVTAFRYPEKDEGGGSVGRLLPNVKAKIIGSDGSEVLNAGASGEIVVKHPGLMTRYLGGSEDTEQCFDDGWFKTGDVGQCEGGKWYIVDRAKEMIKVRAWAVSPAEIEACIISHAEVLDAAVVGIATDMDTGERPVAFVVPTSHSVRKGQLIDEIRAKVQQELASYKSLAEIVMIGSIPRTASGKILRRVLRAQYYSCLHQDADTKTRQLDVSSAGRTQGIEQIQRPKSSGLDVGVIASVTEIVSGIES